MTESAVRGEEDIADDVLENICKMSGVEQNIQVERLWTDAKEIKSNNSFQAQNVFKIDGQETAVRISNKGLTFHRKRKISCFNLKTKWVSPDHQINCNSDDNFTTGMFSFLPPTSSAWSAVCRHSQTQRTAGVMELSGKNLQPTYT